MKFKGSLSYSQESATGPNREPNETSPHLPKPFLKDTL